MASLHDELAALAGQSPAGYIELDCFGRATLDRLQATILLLQGKEIPAGSGALSATMTGVTWAKPPSVELVAPAISQPDREVEIAITSDFTVDISIYINKNPQSVISNLSILIQNACIHIHGEDNLVIIEGSDYKYTRRIIRTPNADQLLANEGIDPLEAARVEGHIGYGVVTQAVSAAIGRRTTLDLAEIFPAVNFGKSIKLTALMGGRALGIIPTETVTINKNACCGCNDGPNLGVGNSTTTQTRPPKVKPGDEVGKVALGGPIAENKNPLKDFGERPQSEHAGLVGLYLPAVFAKEMVVQVMPAIKIVASDNGTIGYRAEANVGFKNFNVSIDVAGGGILLDIDLDISVSAYCDFELFKGFRVPIGWAIISPENGSSASVQLGFYPSVDSGANLKLRSTLNKADMGKYVAVVIGVGTALEIIGVTAWIGFLIDTVLSTILSRGLPLKLREEISKYLGGNEWKLVNGVPVLNPLLTFRYSAPWDATTESLLTSVNYSR